MSEPQSPESPNHPNPPADSQEEPGNQQAKSVRPQNSRSKPLPDWKPLGSIRDYFTEQMRQDNIYRS